MVDIIIVLTLALTVAFAWAWLVLWIVLFSLDVLAWKMLTTKTYLTDRR
jgi:hypothetical protein